MERRLENLKGVVTKKGKDGDETPPVIKTEEKASVKHVTSSDHRGAASVMHSLRKVLDRTEVRITTKNKPEINNMVYDQLLKNRNLEFNALEKSTDLHKLDIQDKYFLDFLEIVNGGYFYNNSFHIYGISEKLDFHDLRFMDNFFHESYQEIVKGMKFFAEDVFGNPFAFLNNKVYLFTIETAEIECLAENFKDFIKLLYEDLDYLTGITLAAELSQNDNKSLTKGKRLSAKQPFIIGGEYKLNNLYLKDFKKNITYNSSIAKQVYNVPDGTKIKIVTKDND